MEFEHQFLLFLQEHFRTGWLNPVMTTITHLGDGGWFFIMIALILLAFPRTRRCGWCMGIALILHLLSVNLCIKPLVARMRPYDRYPDLILLIKAATDYSFPSGHTSASIAASWALLLSLEKGEKRWGVCLMALALLVAFSRLYVGIHYPTDVLAGLLIGTICGLLSLPMYAKIEEKCRRKSA